jgi:hypothetical protein
MSIHWGGFCSYLVTIEVILPKLGAPASQAGIEPAEATADQDVLQRHPVVLAASKQAPPVHVRLRRKLTMTASGSKHRAQRGAAGERLDVGYGSMVLIKSATGGLCFLLGLLRELSLRLAIPPVGDGMNSTHCD